MKIEFRGKRLDNGQWVFGDICHNFNGGFSVMPRAFFAAVIDQMEDDSNEGDLDDDFFKSATENSDEKENESSGLAIGGWFDVNPQTVGQLRFINKSGVKYFDGDVYYHAGYGDETVSDLCELQSALMSGDSDDIGEIKGNIYDNPSLK